ncbi:TPA: hypothetical protein ACGVAU_004394 [Vibrio vulnificus]|uniref:hypothetical protein n=1 Tax=Vibrio TaxID=662 RepID=UPI000D3E49E5|nr:MULTISPECIES: hypothetical protein [Vibrio]MBE3914890.1 hypothetical protein [Vibrio parahaemolyticus]MBT2925363.1 hypothetical protein [Vibrio anguillarum]MCU8207768.1 hypothetical protein [Vibrio vulnificus]PUZ90844.1 hypothetical protein DC364_23045 [Vibrio vulnificus]TNY96436.1 hypothetical protein CGK56_24245 [Vibrio parahaemolyticus]
MLTTFCDINYHKTQRGKQNVIFSEWIEDEFGPRGRAKAAKFLGVSYKTVTSWAKLRRFPRLREQELITLKSKGVVNIDHWRRAYLDNQAAVTQ